MNYENELQVIHCQYQDRLKDAEKNRLIREFKVTRKNRNSKLSSLKLRSKSPLRFNFQKQAQA